MRKKTARRWAADPLAMSKALKKVTPVKDSGPEEVRMRLIAHDAMDVLRRGEATRGHLQVIVEVANICETLATRHKLGSDWLEEIREAQRCIKALAERGVKIRRYVLKAEELKAITLLINIHDAQLDACSMYALDDSINYIRECIAAKKFISLPTIKEDQPA